MNWQDVADHPNATEALRYRHRQLQRAASTFQRSRIGVVKHYARDRKVLDLGCVSHNFSFRSGGGANWLHEHVREVARECVGADVDEVGVKAMQEAGYDVVVADITGDLTALRERGPFELIVAGELIEHLASPQVLLASCRELLEPGGRLILTTPNPYAPRRVRAGTLGVTWENVDHVVYAFPSGIAEMADRTGLVLRRFGTVGHPGNERAAVLMKNSLRELARAVVARARGKRGVPSRGRFSLPLPVSWVAPSDVLLHAVRGKRAMLGENAIYVLRRPLDDQA